MAPDFESRAVDNLLMRNDRFITLLRERNPDRGATVVGPVPWIELSYDAADIGDLARLDVPPGPYLVTLRIDAATHRLARADVAPQASSGGDFKAIFLFVTPARPFTLAAPSEALDMKQA
ncbi:MAG: hypothetical protein M3R55_17940, partial [Acidobacteriota bacterium]|nr:hypothetical protein [Acidobacteriota bacterium]